MNLINQIGMNMFNEMTLDNCMLKLFFLNEFAGGRHAPNNYKLKVEYE